ncbi:CLUMA_CG003980, isoform A [Clunio marinus]|uniref:CLUMA_CG003980, isoform A n=1 Tax=Clunio marinus TaxID=568069 RepID=A0A1J1HQE9_9DIPT|nr:CLUMA_CG003980, isoform A [Clunio marinus]
MLDVKRNALLNNVSWNIMLDSKGFRTSLLQFIIAFSLLWVPPTLHTQHTKHYTVISDSLLVTTAARDENYSDRRRK